MMKTAQEKLDTVETELEKLRAEYEKLGNKIDRKHKQKEKLLLELNEDNLKDPVWLIKNPTMPGSNEALRDLIVELYGSEYDGIHPSGYIQGDGNYKAIQKSFDLSLDTYGKSEKKELFKKNCDHFVENFLPVLEPYLDISSSWDDKFPEVKVVGLMFKSEGSGLDYLGYDPEAGDWYHFTMVYGNTDIKRKFRSWDEAFEFAFNEANKEEDYDGVW